MKKLLSVILCLCMIMTTIGAIAPTSVMAATVYDGAASGLTVANNDQDKDGENSLILTTNVAGFAGKAAGDAVYKISPDDTDDAKFNDAYLSGYQATNGKTYFVSYDVLFEEGSSMFWELWTFDETGAYVNNNTGGFTLSASGLTASKIKLPDNAPTSLTLNQWHNIAVEVIGDATTEDTTSGLGINIYIDGVKYECTLPKQAFGTYCLRSHYYSKTSSTYIDNYYYNTYTIGTDAYDEASYAMEDIALAESEKVTYDADTKQFTLLDSNLTVSELKALITSDYEITVYKDDSYTTALADTDTITMACTVVAYNNDKSYRYYDFARVNDTIFTYSVNADGVSCTVTGYETVPEANSALVIPETIAGYTVTAIGASAFRVDTNYSGVKLSSITMPDTVKNIGNYAFHDTYAALAAWPADLETIGNSAFTHGGKISSVFPEGLKSIGSSVFNFSNLGSTTAYGNGVLSLPEGLESIGDSAFLWCGSLTKVTIPDSVTSIGANAFQTSYGIKSLRLPRNETLTEIPEILTSSYKDRNKNLFVDMSIYIPETITIIPDDFVKHFQEGAKVTIYGVTGSAAYDYYLMVKEGLEAGTYCNAATYPYTAYNKDGTVSWSNPDDADGDGKGELASISFVEYDFDVIHSSDDINIGTTAPKLTTVTNNSVLSANVAGLGGKTADDVVLQLDTKGGKGGENYISSSAEGASRSGIFYHEISVRAPEAGEVGVQFGTYSTTDLKDDPDGDGVKDGYYNLNPSAFWVTNSEIRVMGTKVMDAVAGRWYTIATEIACDGTTGMAVYINGERFEAELDVPAYGVRHFRIYPASNTETYQLYYDNIRSYRSTSKTYDPAHDMPATLVSSSGDIKIGSDAIKINPEVTFTVEELKAAVTAQNANIRVYSDSTLTTLLEDTDNVTNTSVVVVGAKNGYAIERTLSYYPVMPYNTSIYAIEVIDDTAKTARVTGFNEENITDTDDLSGVNIPETIMGYTITEIGSKAFYENTEIQSVTLPDTVTKIGSQAFGNTNANGVSYGNITSVKLPANLKEIGASAFACNNSLKAIELPDGLETIGNQAFYWTGLKELSIPDSVTSIGTNAFRLTAIGYLKLSGGVTSYTSGQFSGANTKITELVIPEAVTEIAVNTFRDQDKDADGKVIPDSDNTAKMGAVVIYGVAGTYAEEYASKYGFEFVSIVANTIVASSGIYGDGSKELAGTDFDIRYGYENLTFKANLINIGNTDTELTVTISLSDASGNVIASTVKDVTVKANATLVIDETSGISIPVETIADGYKAAVTIVNKADSAAVIDPIEFVFSADKREIHVLHIANSFGNDSFGYLNEIAEEDGIVIKNQNMYIGGAKVTQHYKNMLTDAANYQAVINTVYSGADNLSSVREALESDKWDVVALQAATHGRNSNDYAFIDYATWADDAKGSATGVPGVTSKEIYTYIENYVGTYAPNATKIMHMSWGPCEAESKAIYDARFAEEEDASGAVFEAQKAAYEYASTIYADEPNMMVPTSIAVQYALNTLGYQEHSGEVTGEKYEDPIAGEISIYRDETCHLTTGSSPYGRVLAGLTWYEYLTGNDVRKNTYQHSGISADVMAKLKEAAHYANTQVVPITGSEPVAADPTIKVTVVGGSAKVLVNGEDKGTTSSLTATYPVGTSLTYTAVPKDDNMVFLYWKDAGSQAILSAKETIEAVVGSDAEYVAVYANKTTEVYVTFKSNNKIITSGLKGSIEVPANPYMSGYTFAGWYDENGKPATATLDVEENTVYVAGFKADTTKYDITIIGAKEQNGKYKYNEKVTVTAAGEEGKLFTHWTRNDKVVSYSETYTFYVDGAATVTAHYSDTAAQQQIVLVMAAPTVVGDNSDKIAFYAERNVPENYTVIETGILASQTESFDINSSGIIKARATSTANVGQYTIRKANVKSGETWYAKAYLIYSDGTNTYTVYSDMVSKTL